MWFLIFKKFSFLFLCFLIHIFSLKVSQCLRNLFSLLGLLVKCHFLFFKKSFFRSTFVSCSLLLLKQSWFTMLCYFLLHSGVRQPCVYTRPFPCRWSRNAEWTSLCRTPGPHWSSVACTKVCLCHPRPPSPCLPTVRQSRKWQILYVLSSSQWA